MKTTCEVCGNDLVLEKERVYTATESGGLAATLFLNTMYDAADCPKCGCQNILCKRLPRIKEIETEPEEGETPEPESEAH